MEMESSLHRHKSKRKASNLIEEFWDTPKRSNIKFLKGNDSFKAKENNINYDGDIESNDGIEQEKVEKKSKVVRKSASQFDYSTKEKRKLDITASNYPKSFYSIKTSNLYDYKSVYQSCRYHYEIPTNEAASSKVVSVSESGKSCSTETVSTNKSESNKIEQEFLPLESRQTTPKNLNFETPIIAVQSITLDQAIGFSSDARIVVEAQAPYRAVHANAVFHKLFSYCATEFIGLPLSYIMPDVFSEVSSGCENSSPTFNSDFEHFLSNPFQSKSQQQRIRVVFHMIADGTSNESAIIPLISSLKNRNKLAAFVKESAKFGISCSYYMIQCENCDSCDFSHTTLAIA